MKFVTREELKTLAASRMRNSLSIYMPTYRYAPESRQNSVRLKNLLNKAESLLASRTGKAIESRKVVNQAWALFENELRDSAFQKASGCAFFLTENSVEFFQTPYSVEENVVVSDRFHIIPLIKTLNETEMFHLVTLTREKVEVVLGSSEALKALPLPEGIPSSFEDAFGTALEFDVSRRVSRASAGESPQDLAHELMHEYCRRVGKSFARWPQNNNIPMLLAAVEYYHPFFKEGYGKSNLIEPGIVGSPERMRPSELHDLAWKVMLKHNASQKELELSRIEKEVNRDLIIFNPNEARRAAESGRVMSLFISADPHVWGQIADSEGEASALKRKEAREVDLLNSVVGSTLCTGGQVFMVNEDSLPKNTAGQGHHFAAILRW